MFEQLNGSYVSFIRIQHLQGVTDVQPAEEKLIVDENSLFFFFIKEN